MRRTAAIAAAGVLVLLSGCTGQKSATPEAERPAPTGAPPAQVTLSPADGSADVSPLTTLEISVADGELGEVTVVDGAGQPVPGKVGDAPGESDTDVWTPDTALAYGTSYTLTATAENADGEPAEATTTFTTVTPATVSTPSVGPLDGTTVGVGMPIRVFFDDPVVDKAAVESHLRVTSSTPTDGVWSWLTDSEVHFRPSQYWPENIDVTLDADLYGVHFGEGIWGEKDRTIKLRIR